MIIQDKTLSIKILPISQKARKVISAFVKEADHERYY